MIVVPRWRKELLRKLKGIYHNTMRPVGRKKKKKKGQKDDCGGKLLLVWLDVELSLEAKEASLSTWKETPQNKQPKQDTRPQCTIFMCMCECMNIFV